MFQQTYKKFSLKMLISSRQTNNGNKNKTVLIFENKYNLSRENEIYTRIQHPHESPFSSQNTELLVNKEAYDPSLKTQKNRQLLVILLKYLYSYKSENKPKMDYFCQIQPKLLDHHFPAPTDCKNCFSTFSTFNFQCPQVHPKLG